jgi:hypothetical protein
MEQSQVWEADDSLLCSDGFEFISENSWKYLQFIVCRLWAQEHAVWNLNCWWDWSVRTCICYRWTRRLMNNAERIRTLSCFPTFHFFSWYWTRIRLSFATYDVFINTYQHFSCCSRGFVLNMYLRPWNHALILEKIRVAEFIKQFCALYGVPGFISLFPRAHHWSRSWATRVRFTSLQPIS